MSTAIRFPRPKRLFRQGRVSRYSFDRALRAEYRLLCGRRLSGVSHCQLWLRALGRTVALAGDTFHRANRGTPRARSAKLAV